MKTGTRIINNSSLLIFLILLALPGVGLAQPAISALSFTPAAINTSSGPASVTVNFSLTDSSSGISYFETAFVDPFGNFGPRVSKTFSPATSPGTGTINGTTVCKFSLDAWENRSSRVMWTPSV